MKELILAPTKTTFGINFDYLNGVLNFSGTSYPDNAIEFFQPLTDWVKEFTLNEDRPLIVNFNVNYFNTSSSKYLFKILELIDEYKNSGHTVEIYWHYIEGEEDLLDSWKELVDELDLEYEIVMA